MALAMSSPLIFQGLWFQRWFRVCWWIGFGCMVLMLSNIVLGPYLNGSHHQTASVSAPSSSKPLPTTPDELFAAVDAEHKAKFVALGSCKTTALQQWGVITPTPGNIENLFDACMASHGYKPAVVDICLAPSATPENPSYSYVTGRVAIGQREIFDCYVKIGYN